MPVNGEKVSILYYSREAFDNIVPNTNSIYYVEEVDGTLSIFVGNKKARGVEEAPNDNKAYNRRNEQWIDAGALLPERSYTVVLGRLPRPGVVTNFYSLIIDFDYCDALVVDLLTVDSEIHSLVITQSLLETYGSYCDSSGTALLNFYGDWTMETTHSVLTGSISVIMHGRIGT